MKTTNKKPDVQQTEKDTGCKMCPIHSGVKCYCDKRPNFFNLNVPHGTQQRERDTMETYNEMKARHSKEIDGFESMFFAFSNQQFAEGMQKIGVAKDETDKICSIGAGGYILKTEAKVLSAMFKRHTMERKAIKGNEKVLFDALVYELCNHEYCITGSPSDALEALELVKEDIPKGMLKRACIAACDDC